MLTKTNTIVEQEIHAALMKWIDAVEGRELDMLPEVVAPDPSLVWIGTDVTDWVTGYSQLEQIMQAQNNALQDIDITVSDETIHTYPNADYAWATNRWVFRARAGRQVLELPLRCTWILEKRAPGWRIVHFHKSVGMT
jgi:ketosteroid isomerase-like protein